MFRRSAGAVSLVVVATMVAGVSVAAAAQSNGVPIWSPPQTALPMVTPVPGHPAPGARQPDRSTLRLFTASAVTWPSGSAQVSIPARTSALSATATPPPSGPAAPVRAETLPVMLARPAATNGPATTGADTVQVTVADRVTATAAGVNGLLVTLRLTSAGTGDRVQTRIDASGIVGAYGGDYATRLHLVSLPGCALTTPRVPGCRVQTPLSTGSDGRGHLLTSVALPAATRTAAAGQVLIAATAASSGTTGSYTATSLKGSDSWSAGGSSASFTYSYPIAVPPALGGDAPSVALAYDSGSVDGETTNANSQASWIGDGWSYSPGFVERGYKPCAKAGIAGSTDLCWAGDNTVTLSLPGHSGPLVLDDTSKTWRIASDGASQVTQAFGASNSLGNGEYWQITTTDGTSYYFGAGHLPGGNNADPATNSALWEPVYEGSIGGDRCPNAAAGLGSFCNLGYRWNLDYVIDPHGNVTRYTYGQETGNYQRGVSASSNGTLTAYIRASYLTAIDYGWRIADVAAGRSPAAQVGFGVVERCLPVGSAGCDPSQLNSTTAPTGWLDVPYDQNCAAGSTTCAVTSPTFWSTKMLNTITTSTRVGGTKIAVDTYTLGHQFVDPGDSYRAQLWLSSITRTGATGTGGPVSLPAVTFTGTQMANRVPGTTVDGQQLPAANHDRITDIRDETGSDTTITYQTSTCTQPSSVPKFPDSNTTLCYPVFWSQVGSGLVNDWFNKYVVTSVSVSDAATGGKGFANGGLPAPPRVTSYSYPDPPAWHSDDSEPTDPAVRTWDQWRGYDKVITQTGQTPDPITQTETTYLRGMNGDLLAGGGYRVVPALVDSLGGSHPDDNALAGADIETDTFTGASGSVDGKAISTPTVLATVATHTPPASATTGAESPLPAQRSTMTGDTRDRTAGLLASGAWRGTEIDNTYDTANGGRLITSDDKGDGTVSAPELCTSTSYATSATAPRLNYRSRQLTVAGVCGSTPTATNTVADTVTLYDGNTTPGSLDNPNYPGGAVGDVTGSEVIDHYSGGTPVYVTTSTGTFDGYGRELTATDPNANGGPATTTTAYTPPAGALPTQTVVTNPVGWSTTTTLDPTRGVPTHVVDQNGRVTDLTYDGLGRITAVWLPGRAEATQSADKLFTYSVNGSNSPSWTETQTLLDGGGYAATFSILNGFGDVRQTQTANADGSAGRLVTDTFYDSHGWPVKTSRPYENTQVGTTTVTTPSSAIVDVADNQVPGQTVTAYDGQGRPASTTFYSLAYAQWTATTAHPGVDETDTTPPPGGTATSTFTDARGHTTAKWTYHTATATGHAADADALAYTYTPAGQQAGITDATGKNVWRTGYDLRGRVISQVDPDVGTTSTAYTADGQIDHTIDGRGQTVAYSYDLLGRKVAEYSATTKTSATQLASWTYDTLSNGTTVLGQPTSSTRYANGAAYTTAVTGYTATAAGPYTPTGSTVTIPANTTDGPLAGTYTTTTGYTRNTGLLDHTNLPAIGGLPAETLHDSYNTGDELTGTNGNPTAYLADQEYNVFGQPIRATLSGMPRQVVQTTAYDPATGRTLSDTIDKEDNTTTNVDVTTYTDNPAGMLTAVADTQDTGATDTQCYTYNGQGDLGNAWTDTGGVTTLPTNPPAGTHSVPGIGACTHATPPTTANAASRIGGPAAYWTTYHTDSAGNRTSDTEHNITGNTANDITHTYALPAPGTSNTDAGTASGGSAIGIGTGGPNQLTQTTTTGPAGTTSDHYTYDTAGNTLTRQLTSGTNQTFAYDAEGHLATARDNTTGQTSTYIYDANGNLLVHTGPNDKVLYLLGQELHAGAPGSLSALRYIDSPSGAQAIEGTGGTLVLVLGNPQQTTTLAIDSSTLVETRRYYDPFGDPRGQAAAWPDQRAFLDQPTDPSTGLDLLGARTYDPTTGRFLQADPLLETTDPHQLGGYAYAGNDPINSSDPTGLCGNGVYADGCTTDINGDPNGPPPAASSPSSSPLHGGSGGFGGGVIASGGSNDPSAQSGLDCGSGYPATCDDPNTPRRDTGPPVGSIDPHTGCAVSSSGYIAPGLDCTNLEPPCSGIQCAIVGSLSLAILAAPAAAACAAVGCVMTAVTACFSSGLTCVAIGSGVWSAVVSAIGGDPGPADVTVPPDAGTSNPARLTKSILKAGVERGERLETTAGSLEHSQAGFETLFDNVKSHQPWSAMSFTGTPSAPPQADMTFTGMPGGGLLAGTIAFTGAIKVAKWSKRIAITAREIMRRAQ